MRRRRTSSDSAAPAPRMPRNGNRLPGKHLASFQADFSARDNLRFILEISAIDGISPGVERPTSERSGWLRLTGANRMNQAGAVLRSRVFCPPSDRANQVHFTESFLCLNETDRMMKHTLTLLACVPLAQCAADQAAADLPPSFHATGLTDIDKSTDDDTGRTSCTGGRSDDW